jgi:two-component system, LytTR family, sensor kinase
MNRRTRASIAAIAWTGIGGVFALPFILRGGGYSALFSIVINWWLWGAMVPLIASLDDRLSAAYGRSAKLLMAHAVTALAAAILYVAAAATIEYQLGLLPWNPWTEPISLIDWFYWALLVYCLILGTLKGLKYYKRTLSNELQLERLERGYLEARLNALRAQLDPHFLFNALNGISASLERDPRLARKMIEHLGDLLRLSLETRNRQQVTLADEAAFLEHYLALHRIRFGDRLAVTVSITPEVKQARIPSLLLQPLVENAIKHGIANRISGGRIILSAQRAGNSVDIRIIDNGAGLPPGWDMEATKGLGLSVTRERLLAMYAAGECTFNVAPHADGGTEARITLPFTLINEETHANAIA